MKAHVVSTHQCKQEQIWFAPVYIQCLTWNPWSCCCQDLAVTIYYRKKPNFRENNETIVSIIANNCTTQGHTWHLAWEKEELLLSCSYSVWAPSTLSYANKGEDSKCLNMYLTNLSHLTRTLGKFFREFWDSDSFVSFVSFSTEMDLKQLLDKTA